MQAHDETGEKIDIIEMAATEKGRKLAQSLKIIIIIRRVLFAFGSGRYIY